MSKGVKIALGIILILIGVQIIYAGYQQFSLFGIANILFSSFVILIGLLFILASILIFLNKKWVKIPLFILLGIFMIYSAYCLISSFYLVPQVGFSQKLINWQIFLMIEYSVLAILGIILNWKNKID
jgi:hypothetical protein